MQNLSLDQAAQVIGVSTATIRNWIKSDQISPVSRRPLLFLEDSIISLKNQIQSGSLKKLNIRANKAGVNNKIIPNEYSESPEHSSAISRILNIIEEASLESEPAIFLAALSILESNNELSILDKENPFNSENYANWKRESLKLEVTEWLASLSIQKNEKKYNKIYDITPNNSAAEFLGLLHQSLLSVGSKSEIGSYYTPSKIVNDSLSKIKKPINTFLDPCCGAGKYLLHAAKKFNLAPKNIFGFDCDRVAIHLARINILLHFKEDNFSPNIFCIDSLAELATGEIFCNTNNLIGAIDLIATNPPWGAYKNSKSKSRTPGAVQSGETFSLFLERSISIARQGGIISFILPESILKIKAHSDIRELILRETSILNIETLGRQFTGVFTPVIHLSVMKDPAPKDWLSLIESPISSITIPQERFKKNDGFIFDISTTEDEDLLIRKIYSKEHTTLLNQSEWALGIVTGNNSKYILNEYMIGSEPIFRGSDISPYNLGKPTSFIYFTPSNFQQAAPERIFRAPEKLVYKFISKKLVFSYDDKGQLTLNSANILIPKIPGMPIKVAIAFLNSSIFQYLFMKKFSTHKVLRGDLESLPFPKISGEICERIEALVNLAISEKTTIKEIDNIIFDSFNLSVEEILIIKKSITE